MVRGRARIDSLAAGRDLLAGEAIGVGDPLVVPVVDAVPAWLGELVTVAASRGVEVLVEAEPPADRDGEALDGWEIGVCTAAFAAGATDVVGVDPQRVARVRTVTAQLDRAAARPAPEPAP